MISVQSPSYDKARLIKYLLSGKGHDGSEERNIYTDTLNLMPAKDANGYIRQFRNEFDNPKGSKRHRVKYRHMVYSASIHELNGEEDAYLFAEIVKSYLTEHYPNRRALICVQQDGKGYEDEDGQHYKILHCHVALSDYDMYTLKGVQTERTAVRYLSRTFDEHISKNYGIEIDKGSNHVKRRYLQQQLRCEGEKDDQGKFLSYIDDIKDRINRCASASASLSDFFSNLVKYGLSVAHKEKKKSKETYQTYYLDDLSNIADASKDKNGMIKSLAKKNQQPGMRSYKQPGYSLEDIELKIRNSKLDKNTDKDITAQVEAKPEETTNQSKNIELLLQLKDTSKRILNESNKKEEIKAKKKQRLKEFTNTVRLENPNKKNKDFSL